MTQSPFDTSKPAHVHALERLQGDIIIWLSTVRPDGRPHLVPVWFLWDEQTILIFSKPDQKIRNLRQNPAVVLGLDDTDTGEDVVLIEGTAELLPAGQVDTTLPAYAAKYTPKLTGMGWTPASMATEYTEPIRITPTRVRTI
ncbi:MAG TPA: TIGR03618 family F420-dependent PPOX class oxidoreductase [Chloroflexia bacterium]